MSDTVIKTENLSKMYRLGSGPQGRGDFRDAITARFSRLASRIMRRDPIDTPEDNDERTLWALRDASLEVKRGEIVGIIGRNGAGKSTFLKILSRITDPSSGHAWLEGRVGSLLEVGTGFHPELSGRENIFLNGTVLGMTRREIQNNFDEIVEFSEIGKFLDTPVKRYSSGMYVRLAFSVAAHLQPEILLVDEVLAVGDVGFQKKCLGKMRDAAVGGKTVIFVSHNLPSVQSLCTRAVLFGQGRVVRDGDVQSVVQAYLSDTESKAEATSLFDREDREGGRDIRFKQVRFLDAESQQATSMPMSGQPIDIELTLHCSARRELKNVDVGIFLHSASSGTCLFGCLSSARGQTYTLTPGDNVIFCKFAQWPLTGGRYRYTLYARCFNNTVDLVHEAGVVDVQSGDFYGTGVIPASDKEAVLTDFEFESASLSQSGSVL